VDHANVARARGLGPREAILEAGAVRMRPVLMTAAAAIAGMIPVVFARSDGAEWRRPMGVLVVGGLASSTLLTLLVVPVIYTCVDDAAALAARIRATTWSWVRPAASIVSSAWRR
jgi:HAE1 family hydrophobic/amphiphilic exporter-1